MSARVPRFEVVHTGAGQWHSRFRASNGQVVFVTESYKRRRSAWRAIGLLCCELDNHAVLETREVDEREPRP